MVHHMVNSTPRPTSKMEDHHFSVVCDCIFNIFPTTFHIGDRSFICNLRTRLAAPRRGDRDPLIMENSHLMYRKNKRSFQYKVKNKTAHAIKYHAQQRTVKSTLNSAHNKHHKKVNSQVQDSADLAPVSIANAYEFPQTFINSVQSKTISKLMPVFMTDRHQINFFLPL